jgi:hypothetical protein
LVQSVILRIRKTPRSAERGQGIPGGDEETRIKRTWNHRGEEGTKGITQITKILGKDDAMISHGSING